MECSTLVYLPFTTFIKFSTVFQKRSMVLTLFALSIFENVDYALYFGSLENMAQMWKKNSCTFIKTFLK